MWSRFIALLFWTLAMGGSALAGDMTRGLTITDGQNALARLKLERVSDPDKYAFVEALELDGNLLKSGSGQETLFLWSNRTPGVLNVNAVITGHHIVYMHLLCGRGKTSIIRA